MNFNEAMTECVQRDEMVETDAFRNLVFYPRLDTGYLMAEYSSGGQPFEIAFLPDVEEEWEIAK